MLNKYFQSFEPGVDSEQSLIQNLTTEVIQIHGFNVQYIPRSMNILDGILHEDHLSTFDSYFTVECYLEEDSAEIPIDLVTKFGLIIKDEYKIAISVPRFHAEQQSEDLPLEGDLIYVDFSNTLFEIKKVSTRKPFHQLNTTRVYSLTLEAYQYGYEEFSTGINDIDTIDNYGQGVDAIDPDRNYADNDLIALDGNDQKIEEGCTDTTMGIKSLQQAIDEELNG